MHQCCPKPSAGRSDRSKQMGILPQMCRRLATNDIPDRWPPLRSSIPVNSRLAKINSRLGKTNSRFVDMDIGLQPIENARGKLWTDGRIEGIPGYIPGSREFARLRGGGRRHGRSRSTAAVRGLRAEGVRAPTATLPSRDDRLYMLSSTPQKRSVQAWHKQLRRRDSRQAR